MVVKSSASAKKKTRVDVAVSGVLRSGEVSSREAVCGGILGVCHLRELAGVSPWPYAGVCPEPRPFVEQNASARILFGSQAQANHKSIYNFVSSSAPTQRGKTQRAQTVGVCYCQGGIRLHPGPDQPMRRHGDHAANAGHRTGAGFERSLSSRAEYRRRRAVFGQVDAALQRGFSPGGRRLQCRSQSGAAFRDIPRTGRDQAVR